MIMMITATNDAFSVQEYEYCVKIGLKKKKQLADMLAQVYVCA